MYSEFPKDAVVVQKYGGTSVGTVERIQAIAKRTRSHVDNRTKRIAIVVSAMSGETNRLDALLSQVNPHASRKSYDVAISAGEQVSVGLVAAALEGQGIASEPLLAHQLGIRTDSNYSKARIQSINTQKIHAAWENNRIPVVAGFQGMTEDFGITTLGRGGSDTSAVALAVALQASFCEINTDVDGVFTADPRIVPDAKLIERMSGGVALELSALGSKVLHSRCVELALKYDLPLVVRNSFQADASRRTFIMPSNCELPIESPVISGLTLDKDVVKISVVGIQDHIESIPLLFSWLGKAGVNVDIIVHDRRTEKDDTRSVTLGFTIGSRDVDRALEAIQQYGKAHSPDVHTTVRRGLAKVSAVGLGMQSHSGVAAQVFSGIAETGSQILMISTSEIKISCVIPVEEGEKALSVLHRTFFGQ